MQLYESIGEIPLSLTMDDARTGYHQGSCDNDIAGLRTVPYISKQLADLDPEEVRYHLSMYGAWEGIDLTDHDRNLSRLLWLACGDIVDYYAEED